MNYLITGASSGIGEALALQCIRADVNLVLVARRADRLETLVADIRSRGGNAIAVVADLEQESECIRVADVALQELGTIDVVVHNAGRGNYASVEDTATNVWRSMFALNVDAPFFLTRALLPHMKEKNAGHHVYVSSMAGRVGYPFNAAYVAAKHALVGFVAALRAELIGTNVHATVVCPSGVSSEWGNVTEGGSINQLYAKAIPQSRAMAREQGMELAPLKKLITSATAADIILQAIDAGRGNDVYTHEGTLELVLEATQDRIRFEERHRALWLAMEQVYRG